jgi:hypothetical protein
MSRKPRLNLELKAKIKALTRVKSQREIGAMLGIPRGRVYRYQKALGLHAWWSSIPTEAKEKTILGLLREGVPRKRVEKLTRATVHAVRRIAEAHGISRKQLSENQQVVYDIVHRNGSAAAIAKRYNVSHKGVLKLAHKLLQCPTFIGGETKIPLDSYLPQKWPEFAATQESITTGGDSAALFVKLVDAVLTKCFYAKFPFDTTHDPEFAAALLYCFFHRVEGFDSQSPQALDHFHCGLIEAISTLRAAQAARWSN